MGQKCPKTPFRTLEPGGSGGTLRPPDISEIKTIDKIDLGDLQWRHIKMVRKIDFVKMCVNVLLKNMNPRIEIYFL